jgi:hypothetical protein
MGGGAPISRLWRRPGKLDKVAAFADVGEEQLCGAYWIVECDSLERATDIASRLGSASGPEHVRARAYADVRPLAESRHELDG